MADSHGGSDWREDDERSPAGPPLGGIGPSGRGVSVDLVRVTSVVLVAIVIVLAGVIVVRYVRDRSPGPRFCASSGLTTDDPRGNPTGTTPHDALAAFVTRDAGYGTAEDWLPTDEFGTSSDQKFYRRHDRPEGSHAALIISSTNDGWMVVGACA